MSSSVLLVEIRFSMETMDIISRVYLASVVMLPTSCNFPRSSVVFYLSLTLRLLMSYIYGAPSKARNANVVYIWTYVWQR